MPTTDTGLEKLEKIARSFSQLTLYERCPYAYKLQRIDHEYERYAAWLAQGNAMHLAAEEHELSGRTLTVEEAQKIYGQEYERLINEACENTPGHFGYWFASGPYGGLADTERRYGIGKDQVARYVEYYAQNPTERIWTTPDGKPGVELPFDVEFGTVRVRGFIDAIIEDGQRITVRDNKTGREPGTPLQLAVYKWALYLAYGVTADWGDFWMGDKGKPRGGSDMSDWPLERVIAVFEELDANIRAEEFDPKPDPKICGRCSVEWSCPFSMA